MSADYRFSGDKRTQRFRSLRQANGLGTIPILYTGPIEVRADSPAFRQVAAIYDARQKAVVDQAMWTVDQAWAPPRAGATFRDARTCVRVENVGGPVTSRPWREMPGMGGVITSCRNVDGRIFGPNCRWGYWEITPCDLNTATQYMFQFMRYLWAQARLREMIATKPVLGVTSPQAAADWVWLACQYVSVLLWSTNCRFDSRRSYAGNAYADEYIRNGLFLPFEYRGASVAYERPPTDDVHAPLTIVYGDVFPRLLNSMDGDVWTQRSVPVRQEFFSPGWNEDTQVYGAPFENLMLYRPPTTTSTFRRYRIWNTDGTYTEYDKSTPIGLTEDDRMQIIREAQGYIDATGHLEAQRWAESRAYLNWAFRATWNWGTERRLIATVSRPGRTSTGWSPFRAPLYAGGAQLILDSIAAQVEHYANPEILYTSWMQTAITAYDLQISALALPTAVRNDWIRTRNGLNTELTRAANSERATITRSSGSQTFGMLLGVVGLIGGVAALMATLLQALSMLTNALFEAFGVLVNERHACPALPFLRITTGACDVSEDTIMASLLGVDSNASWPLWTDQIRNKTLSLSIDGTIVTTTFASSDTDADAVARRINAAAALTLPSAHPAVASVRRGQVHIEGNDPVSGPVRVLGGTAAVLGFVGTRAEAAPPPPPPRLVGRSGAPADDGDVAAPGGGNGLLVGGGLLLAALAAWAATRKKDPAKMEEP